MKNRDSRIRRQEASARFRQLRSRHERFAPAPVRYTRLANDIKGLRLRIETKVTNSCQFDWFTTFAEMEMLGVNILVVCHQWLGMNNISPGSRIKTVGSACAKSGNFARSGLSTLLISDKFSFSGEG